MAVVGKSKTAQTGDPHGATPERSAEPEPPASWTVDPLAVCCRHPARSVLLSGLVSGLLSAGIGYLLLMVLYLARIAVGQEPSWEVMLVALAVLLVTAVLVGLLRARSTAGEQLAIDERGVTLLRAGGVQWQACHTEIGRVEVSFVSSSGRSSGHWRAQLLLSDDRQGLHIPWGLSKVVGASDGAAQPGGWCQTPRLPFGEVSGYPTTHPSQTRRPLHALPPTAPADSLARRAGRSSPYFEAAQRSQRTGEPARGGAEFDTSHPGMYPPFELLQDRGVPMGESDMASVIRFRRLQSVAITAITFMLVALAVYSAPMLFAESRSSELLHYDGAQLEAFRPRSFTTAVRFVSLVAIADGQVLVATRRHGVLRFDGTRFGPVGDWIDPGVFSRLWYDRETGQVWASTGASLDCYSGGDGLFRLTDNGWQPVAAQALAGLVIYDLVLAEGQLLVATDQGLLRIDSEVMSEPEMLFPGLTVARVLSLDHPDSVIAVIRERTHQGTFRHTFLRKDGQEWSELLSGQTVFCDLVAADGAGLLWFAESAHSLRSIDRSLSCPLYPQQGALRWLSSGDQIVAGIMIPAASQRPPQGAIMVFESTPQPAFRPLLEPFSVLDSVVISVDARGHIWTLRHGKSSATGMGVGSPG